MAIRTSRRSVRCSTRPGRCSALRGAPGNAINHATSYWVGNHSKRVFCEAVDVVCGIGWDKVDADNPAFRFANTYRVVSNLGVFDFGGPDRTMRALSLHPGVSPDEVRENTSFEVHGLDERRRDQAADRRRAAPDPRGHRPEGIARPRDTFMKLRTPLTELVGVEHPVVQTGMGWVAGARLVSATANAGGLGILASATMTLDELATAIGKVKAATDKPFGVNIRADAADAGDRVDLMIREGVKVASFALAPKQELIARLKDAGRGGDSVDRRGQARAQGRGLGRRRDDRAGRRGRRAHRTRRDDAAAAVGAGRRAGHGSR